MVNLVIKFRTMRMDAKVGNIIHHAMYMMNLNWRETYLLLHLLTKEEKYHELLTHLILPLLFNSILLKDNLVLPLPNQFCLT